MPSVFSSLYGPTYSSSLWEWDILPDPPSLLPSFLPDDDDCYSSNPLWTLLGGLCHTFMLTAARAGQVAWVQWHYPCALHPDDTAWPLVNCASCRRRVSTLRILIVCYCCHRCHASPLAVQAALGLVSLALALSFLLLASDPRSYADGLLSLSFSGTLVCNPTHA